MRKIVLILATLCQSLLAIQAQETISSSPFLFDDYKEGIVVLENRSQVKGKLNIYLPTGDFYFIDATDGNKEKVMARRGSPHSFWFEGICTFQRWRYGSAFHRAFVLCALQSRTS